MLKPNAVSTDTQPTEIAMKVILLRDLDTKAVLHTYIVSDAFKVPPIAAYKARANGLLLEERPSTHITNEPQLMSEIEVQRHARNRMSSVFDRARSLSANG
jgi:hypothetical protein